MAGLTGLVLWFGGVLPVSRDPPFRGQPESEWIKNLKYRDDQQVKEWRAYGEEGVQVLIRGLERANRPGERAYRRFNQLLPDFLRRWLPAPKRDSTQETRERLVSLLWSLGSDAKSAAPVMIRTASTDEFHGVRQSAIGFFITSAGDNTLLNQIPVKEKKALLPALLRAVQDPGNEGPRLNAAILLKYYTEERDVVGPVLGRALRDSDPQVRLCAAEALNCVAPELAKQTGATSILVALAKDPDDQLASKAVDALGGTGSQRELAVPVLIECLQSTNTLIACEAVWALEWAPDEFTADSDSIIPALAIAGQRKDSVGGYARVAHKKWQSRSVGEPGGAASGSQPIRSEPNRTSSAADSRR
ncbi:MAG: HEAT repeat domain-containing protein [Verrucomicrobiales bacterium]|nr:HEAT repeat domain-containing protein [Verrucomicrobiales bacterium]